MPFSGVTRARIVLGAVAVLAFGPAATAMGQEADQAVLVGNSGEARPRTFQGHTGQAVAVAFSPDGTRLASASYDHMVRVWDVLTGRTLHTLSGHTEQVLAVAFGSDGARLASAGIDKTIRLWDVAKGEPLPTTFEGHTSRINAVTFSPDGKTLASASEDKTLVLWDVATGESLRTFKGHRGDVNAVSFSPDGRHLASASDDNTLKLWDVETGGTLRTFTGHTHWVTGLAFSPDGGQMASASLDNTLKLWDVASGMPVRTFNGHTDFVNAVAFSPDGARLASASWDNTLKLWDASTGKALRTLSGHQDDVVSVAFSPDGSRLASASDDTTIMMWQLLPTPPRQPPLLACAPTFVEPSGNNALDAEETAAVRLKLSNTGKGPAYGVTATVTGAVTGLLVPGTVDLGDLAAGAIKEVVLPITTTRALATGQVSLALAIADRNGFDAPLVVQRLETRAFRAPRFTVALGVEDGNGNGLVERGEELTLKVVIRNQGGAARGVGLTLKGPAGINWLGGREPISLGDIPAGGWKEATFACLVRNQYAGPDALPLEAVVTEARTDPGGTYPVALSLNQAGPRVIEHVAQAKAEDRADAPAPAPELSDPVDQAPARNQRQPEAHAVIIGIERYKNALVPAVSHARRDATIVREYMTRTLGIPPENVHLLVDHEASLADLRTAIAGKLANALDDPKARVYVYFAGHGAPNLKTKQPYLVPHDGNPAYPEQSCYPLSELYESLGRLKVPVTVMLDACFSGSAGRGDAPETLLANARPALVELKDTDTPPNVSVLAAANGGQVSSSYAAKRHGLFTYFLLKGLGGAADEDKDGRLTLEELHRFVTPAVQRQARKLNREQTPTLQGRDAEVY
jgi:WD40 repeat protein